MGGGFGLERCSLKDSVAGEEGPTKGASAERKVAAAAGGEAPVAREGMTRLPELEVLRHLTRDPRSIAPYNMEGLRGLVEEMWPNVPEEVLRLVVDSFNEGMRKDFIVFQNWVRGEYQEKGYVEVPDKFIQEREEARKRQGEQIDLYLPDRYFTTVVGDDGNSFKEKEKGESNSNKATIFLSCSAGLHPEVKAALHNMPPGNEPEQDV